MSSKTFSPPLDIAGSTDHSHNDILFNSEWFIEEEKVLDKITESQTPTYAQKLLKYPAESIGSTIPFP